MTIVPLRIECKGRAQIDDRARARSKIPRRSMCDACHGARSQFVLHQHLIREMSGKPGQASMADKSVAIIQSFVQGDRSASIRSGDRGRFPEAAETETAIRKGNLRLTDGVKRRLLRTPHTWNM
jgi:hypothetical protein